LKSSPLKGTNDSGKNPVDVLAKATLLTRAKQTLKVAKSKNTDNIVNNSEWNPNTIFAAPNGMDRGSLNYTKKLLALDTASASVSTLDKSQSLANLVKATKK